MAEVQEGNSVTVVGGGIAGMTTALRLAQRGLKVTIYDTKNVLGGNLAAHEHGGMLHDVYPHMFSNWYHNFWDLVEKDLGIDREQAFDSRKSVKVLQTDGTYLEMQIPDPKKLSIAWANLFSGVAPPADMLLWSYSMVDLLTHQDHKTGVLDEVSVNGFVHSRSYSTEHVADLHDFILMVIWSAHSYRVSADAYRRFLQYSFRDPDPQMWVLRGNLQDNLISPLVEKLESLEVEIIRNHRVSSVVVEDGRVVSLGVQKSTWDEKRHRPVVAPDEPTVPVDVDNVVLAVPPKVLGWLACAGDPGTRIVDLIPHLTHARQLRAEPIPVLDLFFKKKLTGLPREQVSLGGSAGNISFLDLSQVWTDEAVQDSTVLTVAASDYYGLSTKVVDDATARIVAHQMVRTLHDYLPNTFEAGEKWGDEDSDVDWERTHFQSNVWAQLYVNEVGEDVSRPDPHHEQVANLFFAGDFCKNDVDMATVEAAVTSGLNAAEAVRAKLGLSGEVTVEPHESYPEAAVLALKLAAAPLAYQASMWTSAMSVMKGVADGRPVKEWEHEAASLWAAPMHYAADVWETAGSLAREVWQPYMRMMDGVRGKSAE